MKISLPKDHTRVYSCNEMYYMYVCMCVMSIITMDTTHVAHGESGDEARIEP